MKRAITGIETLIIFIALVLIAAIAAQVLLVTNQHLEQRALAVGNQVRNRVSNAYEIVRINGIGEDHEIREMDVLVRLIAGSDPQDLRDMVMLVYTPKAFFEATLQAPEHVDYQYLDFSGLAIPADPAQGDLGMDIDQIPDDEDDEIAIVKDCNGTHECFRFWVGDEVFTADLGVDFEGDETIELHDLPLYEDGEFSLLHGYLTFDADFSAITAEEGYNMSVDGFSCNDYAAITNCSIRTETDNNSYAKLQPLYRFSYDTKQGNSDLVLDENEHMTFHFKLIPPYFLQEGDTFEVSIIGSSTMRKHVESFVPELVLQNIVQLWP